MEFYTSFIDVIKKNLHQFKMPSSIDVAATLMEKLEKEMDDEEEEQVVLYKMGEICGEMESTLIDTAQLIGSALATTTGSQKEQERACFIACSKSSTCNFAYHISNCGGEYTTNSNDAIKDGDNVDECDPKCFHAETCNEPRLEQGESIYAKRSFVPDFDEFGNGGEEVVEETTPIAESKPEIQKWWIINWTVIGILALLLFFGIYMSFKSTPPKRPRNDALMEEIYRRRPSL
jgi:hypothetical protein